MEYNDQVPEDFKAVYNRAVRALTYLQENYDFHFTLFSHLFNTNQTAWENFLFTQKCEKTTIDSAIASLTRLNNRLYQIPFLLSEGVLVYICVSPEGKEALVKDEFYILHSSRISERARIVQYQMKGLEGQWFDKARFKRLYLAEELN